MKSAAALKSRFMPTDWPKWLILFAGGILAFGGTVTLLPVVENAQPLYISDPILGIPFLYLTLLIGITELIIAYLCLFTNRRTLSLRLLALLAAEFIGYRIGLWYMGWYHPYVLLGGLMQTLNISPFVADGIASLSSALLLIGSITTLWFGKDAPAGLPDNPTEFQKIPCPSCGGHIKFAAQNLGQRIQCPHCQATVTLRNPGNLKTSCYFCKEHIEFPAHAIGQKLNCPHCKMDITLKEPTS